MEFVDSWLYNKHPAYQVLLILKVAEIVDRKTGMQKNRLQEKIVDDHDREATCYYLRASNGHTYPGV